jgi:hypothetical protein
MLGAAKKKLFEMTRVRMEVARSIMTTIMENNLLNPQS